MKLAKLFTVFAVIVLCHTTVAFAGSITVVGDVNADVSGNNPLYLNVLGDSQNVLFSGGGGGVNGISSLFSGQSGVNITTSSLSAGNLANADLVVLSASGFNVATSFTQNELDNLRNYNGDALVVLEATPSNTAALDSFDAVLEALGSTIRYSRERFSVLFEGPVESHPLTSGVSTFRVNAYNTFTGGTTLLFDNGGRSALVTSQQGGAVPEPATYLAVLLGTLLLVRMKRS